MFLTGLSSSQIPLAAVVTHQQMLRSSRLWIFASTSVYKGAILSLGPQPLGFLRKPVVAKLYHPTLAEEVVGCTSGCASASPLAPYWTLHTCNAKDRSE